MATNQYGQNYSGNDDFRGYLAGNAGRVAGGAPLANPLTYGDMLNFVGNDGGIDWGHAAIYGNKSSNIAGDVANAYNAWLNDRTARGSTNEAGPYIPQNSSSSYAAAQRAAEEERIKQANIAYYNELINQKNKEIDLLGASLQNDLDRINGEYNTYRNEQESAYNKQKNDYDTSTRQNLQNLTTNRNDIKNRTAQGLRGLLGVLGAMGAGGSSVALYNAPDAVKAQADRENANAGQTYSQNQQNLDINWNNYLNDFENDKKKLEDWKTGKIASAKQENEKRRVDLLNQLSEAFINRDQNGTNSKNDIGSIRNRIDAANQAIVDLGRYSAPSYNGVTATYKAPELSSYDTGQTDLTTSVTQTESGSPLLTVLRETTKKKQNSPYTYGMEE